jgi:hypothetical protein
MVIGNETALLKSFGFSPLFPSPGTPAFGSEAQARRGEGQGWGFLRISFMISAKQNETCKRET